MKTNRRDFLKVGAMGVSMSFLAPGLFDSRLMAAEAGGNTVLVVLQLVGGNDAVNTFIPYTDASYRAARPSLGVADSDVIQLDGRMGLHPSLEPLVPLWNQRKFTFVNGVGFDALDRSHFHCQDVWEAGTEDLGHGALGSLGWLGRWADLELGESAGPVASTAVGNALPPGLLGAETIPAVVSDPETYGIRTFTGREAEDEAIRQALRNVYTGAAPEPHHDLLGSVRERGAELFSTIDLVAGLPPESATVDYPASQLGQSFSIAARLIASGNGARVIWIRTGGFDTHAQQEPTHAQLLSDVASSLAAFQTDLEMRGESERVVVMAWSEFGRRVYENASGGTDHGKAGTVFLLGDRVEGGAFVGDVPNLSDLDGGDLKTTIDFRSVYRTLITDWLGGDASAVLGGNYENLGLIRSALPNLGRRRAVGRG